MGRALVETSIIEGLKGRIEECKENKDKLPADDVKKIEELCEKCKKAIEAKNSDEIKKTMEELTKASHKMAETMYKASTAKEETKTDDSKEEKKKEKEEKKDDNVVDAEFEETKE